MACRIINNNSSVIFKSFSFRTDTRLWFFEKPFASLKGAESRFGSYQYLSVRFSHVMIGYKLFQAAQI